MSCNKDDDDDNNNNNDKYFLSSQSLQCKRTVEEIHQFELRVEKKKRNNNNNNKNDNNNNNDENGEEDEEYLPPFPRYGVKIALLQRLRDIAGTDVDGASQTTTQVCNEFIKPWTKESNCSLVDLFEASYHDAPHPKLGLTFDEAYSKHTATCFISHAWSYKFSNLVACIEAYIDSVTGSDKGSISFWVDLVLNNQHCTSKVPQRWWKSVFLEAISDIGHTVMVALPWHAPTTLTRSWCLWELYCSRKSGSKLTLQMCDSEITEFQRILRTAPSFIMNAICQIDVIKSDAFNPDDKAMIFDAVRSTDEGIQGVNLHVTELLREWIASSAKAIISTEQPTDVSQSLEDRLRIAELLSDQGKLDEAEEMLSSYCDSSLSPHLSLSAYGRCLRYDTVKELAKLKYRKGKLVEAKELYERAMSGYLSLDNTDCDTKTIYYKISGELANVLRDQGDLDKSKGLYEAALGGLVDVIDLPCSVICEIRSNYADLLRKKKEYSRSKDMFLQALQGFEESLCTDHPTTLATVYNLAITNHLLGELNDAKTNFTRVHDCWSRSLGKHHCYTLKASQGLSNVLRDFQDYSEALQILNQLMCPTVGFEATLGAEHPWTLLLWVDYARTSQLLCRRADAEIYFKKAISGYESTLGLGHPEAVEARRFYDLFLVDS